MAFAAIISGLSSIPTVNVGIGRSSPVSSRYMGISAWATMQLSTPAREEESVVNVGHHALFDGGAKGGADFFIRWVSFGFPGGVVILML